MRRLFLTFSPSDRIETNKEKWMPCSVSLSNSVGSSFPTYRHIPSILSLYQFCPKSGSCLEAQISSSTREFAITFSTNSGVLLSSTIPSIDCAYELSLAKKGILRNWFLRGRPRMNALPFGSFSGTPSTDSIASLRTEIAVSYAVLISSDHNSSRNLLRLSLSFLSWSPAFFVRSESLPSVDCKCLCMMSFSSTLFNDSTISGILSSSSSTFFRLS